MAGIFFVQQLKHSTMSLIKIYLQELDQEAVTTRKMLSRVPDDKFDWKPHEKSMSLKALSTIVFLKPIARLSSCPILI